MKMSETDRDNLLSSGPARFHFLSAYHADITGRLPENFGEKLANFFPHELFGNLLKLEAVYSYLTTFPSDDAKMVAKTKEMIGFCKALANIYQVTFQIFDPKMST
jgi:hypothetical protein